MRLFLLKSKKIGLWDNDEQKYDRVFIAKNKQAVLDYFDKNYKNIPAMARRYIKYEGAKVALSKIIIWNGKHQNSYCWKSKDYYLRSHYLEELATTTRYNKAIEDSDFDMHVLFDRYGGVECHGLGNLDTYKEFHNILYGPMRLSFHEFMDDIHFKGTGHILHRRYKVTKIKSENKDLYTRIQYIAENF